MSRLTPLPADPLPRSGSDAEAKGAAVQHFEAQRLDAGARSPSPDFTYRVLANPEKARPAGERRSFTRQRTKLRSGKIIHPNGQFITECLVHNMSDSGCRLRLPAATALPQTLYFFDDQSERLFQAVVMWRRDKDVGLRLLPGARTGQSRALAGRMGRKFYALGR